MLERAGLKAGAAPVVLQGADQPVLPTTPRFGRSVPLAKALHPATLLAYERPRAAAPGACRADADGALRPAGTALTLIPR